MSFFGYNPPLYFYIIVLLDFSSQSNNILKSPQRDIGGKKIWVKFFPQCPSRGPVPSWSADALVICLK